jgi:energy-coupling factor transporter ATP-binding protein EcfA2
MLMINVLIRRPSLLLIDEPETGLHASLQLDLLTTLAAYCDSGVLFATHSVSLARAAADRIYTVSPSAEGSLLKPYEQVAGYEYYVTEDIAPSALGRMKLTDIRRYHVQDFVNDQTKPVVARSPYGGW